jgi:pimeloyl-ACP methyl ester carboxylesterase
MSDAPPRNRRDPEQSPIGHLHGVRPPAPAWFEAALADAPERGMLEVEGAQVEMLAWGRRGDPGLLLLHGFAANADWWSFIAPFLAEGPPEGRRVVALSWTGMGGSGWRDAYSMDQHAREALAVAEAGGLFEAADKPMVVGHSYGSVVAMVMAQDHGERLKGIVVVDGPLSSDRPDRPGPNLGPGTHQVYADLPAALARFRFTPPQTCENLFVVDHIGRTSLRQAPRPDGTEGWTWKFDAGLRGKTTWADRSRLLTAPQCPVALIFGDRSKLMTPERLAYMRSLAPAGSPWFDIPDAGHHVMVDQPLALVAGLRGLLSGWPQTSA